jgi:hypothetical protein
MTLGIVQMNIDNSEPPPASQTLPIAKILPIAQNFLFEGPYCPFNWTLASRVVDATQTTNPRLQQGIAFGEE